jgi:alkylated DNA repair dioxygenase AlkB
VNQLALLGREEPAFDAGFSRIERMSLGDDAWVEHQREFVSGHARLFDEIEATTRWRHDRTQMYDKLVDVPRLFAILPDDGPGHPLFERIRHALSERYGELFVRTSLAKYRDGNDSVAWHGDRVARRMPQALVATLSLGGPRRFLLRPYGGGSSIAWSLGWGDLFVMGGSCQRTWQHSVPKVRHGPPRIAIMFRPAWAE